MKKKNMKKNDSVRRPRAPGIGKSSIMEAVAKATGMKFKNIKVKKARLGDFAVPTLKEVENAASDYVINQIIDCDPLDMKGYEGMSSKQVYEVLMCDELGCAPKEVQNMLHPLFATGNAPKKNPHTTLNNHIFPLPNLDCTPTQEDRDEWEALQRKKMKKPDKYHRHEALDRAHMLSEMWGMFVKEQYAVEYHDDLRERAEEIGRLMGAFYQKCGEKFL